MICVWLPAPTLFSYYSSQYLPFKHIGLSYFFMHVKLIYASRSMHLLFLLPRILSSVPLFAFLDIQPSPPEKEMATHSSMAPHSSTLAWKIPWMEAPGRLQSMGLLRVGNNWVTSLSLFTFMHWRRKWQPTPVFLLGESQGRRSLVGCRLWGRTELDTTEVT